MSVERVDKDKDAEENVDADQTSMGRPVLVDQKEEHEIDFRVSGLPHARQEDRESSSSRSTSSRFAAK